MFSFLYRVYFARVPQGTIVRIYPQQSRREEAKKRVIWRSSGFALEFGAILTRYYYYIIF
jgi:hypothetical protein